MDGLSWISHVSIFLKAFQNTSVPFSYDRNNGHCTWRPMYSPHLAQFFLEWEMFQTNVLEKIKTHIFCAIIFFPLKSCCLWNNMERYCTVRQTTDENIIRRMRFAWWLNEAADTHSEYVIRIAFPWQQWLGVLCVCRCNTCLVKYNLYESFNNGTQRDKLMPPPQATNCIDTSLSLFITPYQSIHSRKLSVAGRHRVQKLSKIYQ